MRNNDVVVLMNSTTVQRFVCWRILIVNNDGPECFTAATGHQLRHVTGVCVDGQNSYR